MVFNPRPGKRGMFPAIRHGGGGLSPKAETILSDILNQVILNNPHESYFSKNGFGVASGGANKMFELTGKKGIVLGGTYYHNSSETTYLRIKLDGEIFTSRSFNSLLIGKIYEPGQDVTYLVSYEAAQTPKFVAGISPGLLFDTSIRLDAMDPTGGSYGYSILLALF